jgi:hypothetical protein
MRNQRSVSQPEAADGQRRDAWLVAAYRPVTLFSLRMTHATSKGGKTLVVPTPYSVKMALLDACFRCYSSEAAPGRARGVFDRLKRREIQVRPPKHCVVNNTFIKVLDWSREPVNGPFRNTIVYREFVFFSGDELLLAIEAVGLSEEDQSVLEQLFAHINSLGKRGGFWQFVGSERVDGALPFGFTVPRPDATFEQTASYALTQALDDFGEALCTAADGFERVSTYGSGTVRLGEQRILTATAIPYRRRSASRHFTWYERVQEARR